jgi:hypothetical protein
MKTENKYDGYCIPPAEVEKIVIRLNAEYQYFNEDSILAVIRACCAKPNLVADHSAFIVSVRERLRLIYLSEN